MPRRARILLPSTPTHIIQRGNNRQACFYAEQDYQFYLDWFMNGNRHDFDRYNLDKDLTQVIRPDGQTVSLDYDSGGRLSGMHIARGRYQYSYHTTAAQLTSLGCVWHRKKRTYWRFIAT